MATDIFQKNWGFGFNLKYSFYPTGKHVDHHFLRDLTLYADYDKNGQAWMGNINYFWEFVKDWKLRLGADWTLIRIDGKHWDESGASGWKTDVSTDTKQWIYWGGVEYKF